MKLSISRVIPTDEFLALINANLPSASNPFATISDLITYTNIVKVNTYADLPDPTTVSGQLYYVITTTGFWWWRPTYKPQGFYYSDGISWTTAPIPYMRNTIYKTGNYTIDDLDRNVECNGTFTVTFPLLINITHYENIDITNSGTGLITVNTSGGELLGDVTTFVLYPFESLTIAKGNTKYLVK
jgi:hypothetical protein